MKDQQLYIDGVLVDIDDKTKITLDIKSNLLRDISKLTSNSTYTVKLPKTVHNQRIFEHADIVQSPTAFPYTTHAARYVRNGVEIISNGRAVVLGANECFEVTIVWGLFPALSSIISAGTTLNQLESNARILYKESNALTPREEATDVFYAHIDNWVHDNTVNYDWRGDSNMVQPEWNGGGGHHGYGTSRVGGYYWGGGSGSTSATEYKKMHPSVSVAWLIGLIAQKTGVAFNWSGEAKAYIDTLIIPLINRKSNALTFDSTFEAEVKPLDMYATGAAPIEVKTANVVFSEQVGTTSQQLTCTAQANLILDITVRWQFDLTGAHRTGYGTGGDDYLFDGGYNCRVMVGNKEYLLSNRGHNGSYMRVTVPNDWQGVIVYEEKGWGKIEVKAGETISVEFVDVNGGGLKSAQFLGGTLAATLSSDENVPSGGYFPVVDNLPKIKIIDFVKFLAAITGTFPLQLQDDNIVTFVPIATVWQNKDKAVDWTRRIVPQTYENKPKSLEFKISGYAQHNLYKWKQDDTVTGEYDGEILINDTTLDVEKTIFEFPFAATDGNNVPIYTAKGSSSGSHGTFGGNSESTESSSTDSESNEPSYKACKDRILRVTWSDSGYATAYFDIDMQEIINNKYRELTGTLNSAKVIKERVRISNAELLQVDETIPVYLAQYGGFFAIIEIKTGDSGFADITMLQLNV